MKKSTLIFGLMAAATLGFSQATMMVTAPPFNNATTQVRAPNGTATSAYMRGAAIVQASELTGIAASTTLTSFGYTTTVGADAAVTGTIVVYLQNTGDATYNKGTNWGTITTGMTTVYTGTITLPTTATTFDLPLTTPFVYTGGAMYVAYDFYSAGPYATVPVTYAANNGMAASCVSGSSGTAAPTTLSSTAFRPCFRFGFANPLTNDMSVESISSLGNIPNNIFTNHAVTAVVRNNSNTTLTNVGVGLNVTGVNTFTNAQFIPSIGAGNTATVTFAPYTLTSIGTNTISVGVLPDQNNANNQQNFNQTISCNTWGFGQNPMTYTGSVGFNTGEGMILSRFNVPTAQTVVGANLAISTNTANAGNPLYAALVDNSGNILATSNTITIMPPMYGTWQSFTFTPGVAITGSTDYHIGLVQTANTALGYFPMGTYPVSSVPSTLYSTRTMTASALTPLTTNLGIMGIEANFAGACITGINNVEKVEGNVSVYPNPASTFVNVKLQSQSGDATVAVYNAIGQMVIEPSVISTDNSKINVSNLPKGVYIVKVVNGTETSNTKIVIER